jgi:DNA-binding NarL/FixJ family response regulator
MGVIRIVVAEDHTFVREALCRVLVSQPDFRVVGQTSSGEEAVRLVADLRPDVLLLDLALPVIPGAQVVRHVRDQAPDVRIIVLTGQMGVAPHAIAAMGVRGYLLKQSTADAIVSAVRAVYAGCTAFDPWVAQQLGQHASQKPGLATKREQDVLHRAAEGLTNREIADRLKVREATVEFHLRNLFRKLGAGNRTEMVHRARQAGWVE